MKQQLLITALMIATIGMIQAASADSEITDIGVMNQDLSALPEHSLLIFNSDYTVNMMEDFSFTPACHFEPGMPSGSDVTPAGTVFKLGAAQEIVRHGETKISIIGRSEDGREVLIHCDKTNLPIEILNADSHAKGLSIVSVKKGLKETANIDLVVRQAEELSDIYFERLQIKGSF